MSVKIHRLINANLSIMSVRGWKRREQWVRLPISVLRVFGWPFLFGFGFRPSQISCTIVRSISKASRGIATHGWFVGSCCAEVCRQRKKWVKKETCSERPVQPNRLNRIVRLSSVVFGSTSY